jgi:hypothetical protein
MPPPATPVASFRTSRIFHAALVGSLVVYAVVVHVIEATGSLPRTVDPRVVGAIRPQLYGLGAAVAVTTLVLRSRWLSMDAAAPLARLGVPAALAQLQTRLIVCLALAESLGVLGLLLFVLGGSLRDFYVSWTPAIVLQLLLRPGPEVWAAATRARP